VKLGLIVNPVAGLGGRVALKGSDGALTQQLALERGAVPRSGERAVSALEALARARTSVELLTSPGAMGEDAARAAGIAHRVVGAPLARASAAADTRAAALELRRQEAQLIMFAGGDGTARDVFDALGGESAVLGIPTGVKIHSAAFALSPQAAGDLAAEFALGRATKLHDAEVMDVDEDLLRRGVVAARLYGVVRMPRRAGLVQGAKVRSDASDEAHARSIAARIARDSDPETTYVIGPGSTTARVKAALGIDGTLVGVDVVRGGVAICVDADESALLEAVSGGTVRIVITPVGGQGYVLGRGNQQISPGVLRAAGAQSVTIVAAPGKLQGLGGRPLLVDTGDDEVDDMLSGYARVVTGHEETCMYKVRAASRTVAAT
jgi:predicted polyphosphate/ATP-dependent NAD kinase